MKRFWLIFLSVILGLFTACSEDGNSINKNSCNPECKAYQSCNNGNCELQVGMCVNNSDCKDSNKPICDANECIAESNDCNPGCDDSYQICNNKVCTTKTGMCESNSECKDSNKPICSTSHQCIADNNGKMVTIKELKNTGIEGNKYTTHGIVTATDNDGFFIQDDSNRGIYIFMNLANGEFMAQKVGDKVTVTGMYKIYRGFNEITYFEGDNENPSIDLDIKTDSSNNNLPQFKEIDAGIKTLENFESMLVRLKNPTFTIKKKLHDPSNHDYELLDSTNKAFIASDYMYSMVDLDGKKLTNIQGILKFHKDNYKLAPRNASDVKEKTLVCDPSCVEYKECNLVAGNPTCELKPGKCENQIDCEVNQSCENNTCIIPNPVNLVPNGDLETWLNNDEADGWIYEYNNQAGTTATKESSIVFEGSFAAKVKKLDSASNTSGKKNEFLSPAFEIDNTKEYDISMKIYDNDVNVKARVYFKFYDETNHSNSMSNLVNGYTSNFDGWKEYTYPSSWSIYAGINPGSETGQIDTIKTMRVGVRLYDDEGSGDGYIYLDDVKVTERQ